MPLDTYSTRPDFSRQIKQYSGTTATLSGITNILEKFSVKSIEIDTANPQVGNSLVYDGSKFLAAASDAFSNTIYNGLVVTYKSGLTFDVSAGFFKIRGINYPPYNGGTVDIISGDVYFSRFDLIYITSASTPYARTGVAAISPIIPSISGSGELQLAIISVPPLFTGGTGYTLFTTTSATVFNYYNNGTGIIRTGSNAQTFGQFSFATSIDSKAYADHSIAMGLGAESSGNSQTVVGQYNTLSDTDYFIVGNGINNSTRNNAFTVDITGGTNVKNKLYVSGYEIITTGASTGQALVYDGTKFKPQNVSGGTSGTGGTISGLYVSGITSAGTGNIHILSSVTSNNNLVYKTISAGTGIAISESNGTLLFSKSNTYFTTGISSSIKTIELDSNYIYDNIILTSTGATDSVTAFTFDVSINSYIPTPSIRFFAQSGLIVTFQNSNSIKTEGGLDAVIVGANYDSVTFEYNTATTKFYQTNINNYI